MDGKEDRLEQLQKKLNGFLSKQEEMQKEVLLLRSELRALKIRESFKPQPNETGEVDQPITQKTEPFEQEIPKVDDSLEAISKPKFKEEKFESESVSEFEPKKLKATTPKKQLNLEKLIGENIINKIGIFITVLGVGIGANYAFENNLISPVARIIIGYVIGLGLLGFAIRFKEKYHSFSAVLLGGALASMYLVTYAAYSFYDLIPQLVTFVLMVMFTAFTVFSAIKYDKQTISLVGLVGAYAVPFLLSSDSGNEIVLFSYMTIINLGILIVAFNKYWKLLYYSSFTITWLIFGFWFSTDFSQSENLLTALLFSTVFYGVFYATFLGYKLIKLEAFTEFDIAKLLMNSFIYFGFGYSALSGEFELYQGVFSIFNAAIHFAISMIVYSKKLESKSLQNFVSGLVLIFLTLAIPIQLDGSWVTIIWVLEGLLLFWISRTKSTPLYERLAYPVLLLGFLSLLEDWSTYVSADSIAIWNTTFLTSLIFISSYLAVLYFNNKYPESTLFKPGSFLRKRLKSALVSILVFVIFFSFRFEIITYFDNWFQDSRALYNDWNYAILNFESVWLLNYTFFFLSISAILNIRKFRSISASTINLWVSVAAILFFFFDGIFELQSLRELYLYTEADTPIEYGISNLLIRYLSFSFIAFNIYTIKRQIEEKLITYDLTLHYEGLLHVTILFILSAELIHWMDIFDFDNSYKLGLSILWGLYSLGLVSLGILKKKTHLRIGAIGLFSVTLVKLFFYDISHLSTISKTIVFVSLGILLLIISFLYNKFKTNLFEEDEVD